jgi:uncharacterized damage-inducible protein DinB
VGLDHVAHDSFEDLRAARVSQDEHIIRCVEGLTEADLAAEFTYTHGHHARPVTQPLAPRSRMSSTTRPTIAARPTPC